MTFIRICPSLGQSLNDSYTTEDVGKINEDMNCIDCKLLIILFIRFINNVK